MLIIKALLAKVLSCLKPQSGTATKVGNYYSSGSITYWRKGGCVQVRADTLVISARSARTVVATIPVGFRPPVQSYGVINGTNEYFVIDTNGNISFNAGNAGTLWATACYPQWY